MKIIYILLFFVAYHYVLNAFLKRIIGSKLMSFIARANIFSILTFGILIPISAQFFILNLEDNKYFGFVIAISFIYTKFFFNYKILNNETKN